MIDPAPRTSGMGASLMVVNWWYVTSASESFPIRALAICALRAMVARDHARLTVVRIDELPAELGSLGVDPMSRAPDAVVVSDPRVLEDLRFDLPEPRAPIFDMGWVLGQDSIDSFVLGDGETRFGIDKDGGLTGTPAGWPTLDKAAGWLKSHAPTPSEKVRAHSPGGDPNAPPQAHPGARVAEGSEDTSAVVAVVCWLVGEAVAKGTDSPGTGKAVDAICHVVLEGLVAGAEYLTDTVPNLPPSQPAGGVPDGGPGSIRPRRDAGSPPRPPKNEPGEEDGRNLMLMLKEWAEARRFEEQRARKEVMGEPGDVRREWVSWLHKEQIEPPDTPDRITPEDETGYAFLYWMYLRAGEIVHDEHHALKHAWLRGAPIDPAQLVRRAAIESMLRTPSLVGHVTADGALDLAGDRLPPGGGEEGSGEAGPGHHG